MKILHWNIHMWMDETNNSSINEIEALILNENPDLISLVEVDEEYSLERLKKFADDLDYNFVFVPCFEYMDNQKRFAFGNVILSRFPFYEIEHKWITPTSLLYDGDEPSEPRSVTWVKIKEVEEFYFGTTHFSRSNAEYREEALKLIKNNIDNRKIPIILAGDFNTNKDKITQIFCEEKYMIVPSQDEKTYPCSKPNEAIDYFIITGMAVENIRKLVDFSSDHFPITIETV